jgi:predicted DNA-binding transcriptional regulator YafY
MKSERLVALLLLLQGSAMRTARELACSLEVSERTIYRDVEALGAAGIPVYTERGAEGGIALSEGYRRALMHFSEEEVRALFVPGSAILSDLGMGASAERAFDKLRGGLSTLQQSAIERVRERIFVDQRRWNQDSVPVEILALLRRAVWDERRVEIAYRDRERKRSLRSIDPLGLVSKAGVWYVIAQTDAGVRSFRADRIESAVETRVRFERPANFTLERYWREASEALMRMETGIEIELLVPRESASRYTMFFPAKILDDGDPQRVAVTFPSREAAIHWIVAGGTGVSVVEPAAIVREIVAHAEAVVRHHSKR